MNLETAKRLFNEMTPEMIEAGGIEYEIQIGELVSPYIAERAALSIITKMLLASDHLHEGS